MTELVVVMIIVGIMAAMALPRWGGTTGFEERGFRDKVASALRYAQKAAVAARRHVCVSFTETTLSARIAGGFAEISAADFAPGDCTLTLQGPVSDDPDSDALTVWAKGAAAFSAVPDDLIFDPLGRPDRRLEITFTNLDGLPVIVEAETGHVH
jgi:MSHA pilin protein MshC